MCKTVKMPKELTAENGAKALLSGEFSVSDFISCGQCDHGAFCLGDGEYEECDFCEGQGGHFIELPVPWDSIKNIYRMAVDGLSD